MPLISPRKTCCKFFGKKSVSENKYGGYMQKTANKALQKTQTALSSFGIFLSHNGLVPVCGLLPVVTARFGLLSAGVSNATADIKT